MPFFRILPLIKNWKKNLYWLSLAAYLVALPTSIAFLNCTAVALFIVWVLMGNYREKWERLKKNRAAQLMMVLPLFYLVALLFSENLSAGLQLFNKSLPWLIMGFVLGSSQPISKGETKSLLLIYVAAVMLAAAFALGKLFGSSDIQYFDFREVTWIDHIPFSIQVAFSIAILFAFIYFGKYKRWLNILFTIGALFLLFALLSLKSFSAYFYFGIFLFVALLNLVRDLQKKSLKILVSLLLILLVFVPVIYITHCFIDFYNVEKVAPENIKKYTAAGNLYEHDFSNHSKENGHYTFLYVCEEELSAEWDKLSAAKYHSLTDDGFLLRDVIVRYMSSKGLTKDSAGLAQLTPVDIQNIENKIPNVIFADEHDLIYPRVYETIWELDQYLITGDPRGKSLAERMEMHRLGWKIVQQKPFWGNGIGDNKRLYDEAIETENSKLIAPQSGSSHNQYLNYLIQFGVFGTTLILAILGFIYVKGRKNHLFLMSGFFFSMLAANFLEANLETVIGLNFFAFFIAFLMWIAPEKIWRNDK